MARPAEFVPIPASVRPGRYYREVATGRELNYRQYLDIRKQAEGFRNQEEFARLSREAKSATSKTRGALGGTDLAAEFRAYAQQQQILGKKPEITKFLQSYKQAVADRERTKGGDFERYLEGLGRGEGEEERQFDSPRRQEQAELGREFQRLLDEEEEVSYDGEP